MRTRSICKDSGVDVRVGLHAGSASRKKAEAEGLTVLEPAAAAEWADVIMVLVPDTVAASLYRDAIRRTSRPATP